MNILSWIEPNFPILSTWNVFCFDLKALSLLELAWKRRLTFTIGTSVTTGEQDVVVWNEIHHKTDMTNDRGHGYPDPNYLNNVMNELAAQGVVDEDDDDDS